MQRENRMKKKKEQNSPGLWDSDKRCSICIMEHQKDRRKKQKKYLK